MDLCKMIAFTSSDWQQYGYKIIPNNNLAFEICTDNSVKAKFGDGIRSFSELDYVNKDFYNVISDKIDKIKNAISISDSIINGTCTLNNYVLDDSQMDISFTASSDITGLTITSVSGTQNSTLSLPNLSEYDVFVYKNGIATVNNNLVTVSGDINAYKNAVITVTVTTGTVPDIDYSYIEDINMFIGLNIINHGNTLSRPINNIQYQQYWDDDLNKLIIFKGSAWYDSMGNEV